MAVLHVLVAPATSIIEHAVGDFEQFVRLGGGAGAHVHAVDFVRHPSAARDFAEFLLIAALDPGLARVFADDNCSVSLFRGDISINRRKSGRSSNQTRADSPFLRLIIMQPPIRSNANPFRSVAELDMSIP